MDEIPEVHVEDLMQRIYDAQDFLLDKMSASQQALFRQRAAAKDKKGAPRNSIQVGMPVLVLKESLESKIAWKVEGPDIVVALFDNPVTNQVMAQLNDPTGSVREDRLVHLAKLKPFYYDERYKKSIQEIRALDTGEYVIDTILSHRTCTPDKPDLLKSYDFECLWSNGFKNWLPWESLSNTMAFEDYMFDKGEEFEPYFRRQTEAWKKKSRILPTIFQERRKKVPKVVLNQNPNLGAETVKDDQGGQGENAVSYMGAKNADYGGIPNLVGITADLFHNVNNLKYEDILDKMASKFGPGG